MNEQLVYQIALSKIEGIGSRKAKLLVSYCGGVEEVFKKSKKDLIKIPNIGTKTLEKFDKNTILTAAEKEAKLVEKEGISTCFYLDQKYPKRLKNHEDSPVLLYSRGEINLDVSRTVGIVGTRKPTSYGKIQCEKLVAALLPYQVSIISGLAFGIDATAHQAACDHGIPTVGILGNGLSSIYPAQNRKLANRMMDNGGVISEFDYYAKPDRAHFPMRNRIIAALSDVVIVVESARKGGSIITAEIANDYNKDVFAIPGKVHDEKSEGCNKLIKQHKANLLESVQDISYIMRWEEEDQSNQVRQQSLFLDLSQEEKLLIENMPGNEEIAIDKLHHQLSFSMGELSSVLLNLEFKGIIKSLPGKNYILV